MFKSILVPLDGSSFAEHALPWAVTLASKAKAALHLVHTHPHATEIMLEASPFYDEELKSQLKSKQRVYLDGLAQRGPHLREVAARAVRTILGDPRVAVHPQSRESFLAGGLRLYEQRYDKGYSLVDCISMTTMRRHRISEVLTNDHHFTQEGFKVVIR